MSNRKQLRNEKVNFNTFFARACARSGSGDENSNSAGVAHDTDGPTAMPLYTIWTLRRALEDATFMAAAAEAPSNIDPQYDVETKERLVHLATVHVLDGYVAPAVQWVFHAGRRIYDCCSKTGGSGKRGDLTSSVDTATTTAAEAGEDGNEDAAAAGGGDLWTGGTSFSHARWAFWKQRFAWVAEQCELVAGTRDVARVAADAMERIEREAAAGAKA
jgi:hypothetical protein